MNSAHSKEQEEGKRSMSEIPVASWDEFAEDLGLVPPQIKALRERIATLEKEKAALEVAGDAMAAKFRYGDCNCFAGSMCIGCRILNNWNAAKGKK